ncbi:MAG TPA: ABC transporter ATP-binding protein [Trueperaceae bacterium]
MGAAVTLAPEPASTPASRGGGISIRGLDKTFEGGVRAVRDVSLEVPEGAFLVLLGPSGCGKTTMLRMLAGLEHPTGGEIRFGDTVVASGTGTLEPSRRNAGLVFQSYALWPHMTVRGNVEWPLKVAGWDGKRRAERVAEVLALLGIQELAARYPNEVSGGQQQRVAIARTLAPRPKVLLFDEPLSNLDAKLRVEMRAELLRLHRATGATSVYVTHDQIEAMTMASHVAVMNHGVLEQFGPPQDLLASPASAFVATFIGTPPGNLLPVRVVGGRYVFGDTDMGEALGAVSRSASAMSAERSHVQLLFRPEDLTIQERPGGTTLPIDLAEITPMAGRYVITGFHDGKRLTAVSDRVPDAPLGATVHLTFPSSPAAVFDDEGARIA